MAQNKVIWTAEHVLPFEGHYQLFVFERAWDAYAKCAELRRTSFATIFVRCVPLGSDVFRQLEHGLK